MKTVLRYAGGKSKAIKKISPFIPSKTKQIISPFIGGGSLEVEWSTKLDIKVKGFDIFEHLVNFWKVLLNNNKELSSELKKLKPNKNTYEEVKKQLLSWEETQKLFNGYKTNYYRRNPIKIDKIKAAAYYFFNHNLSYGPAFLGWMSKIYEDKRKYDNMIKKIENFHNKNLSVDKKEFDEVIPNYPKSLIYCDPPYYLGKDKDNKMFKGMYPMANFPFHHNNFDHKLLRNLLYLHKGEFILSYNNCETIRNWYSDFYQYFPSWKYSYGQGETRIGKNKIDNRPKKSHEILITNIKRNMFFN